jgi:hypothetical protein
MYVRLQELFSKAIPSSKCHMNMGPVLSGYGAVGIGS